MYINNNQYFSIAQMAAKIGWSPQRLRKRLPLVGDNLPYMVQGGHILFDEVIFFQWYNQLEDKRKQRKAKTK